MKMQRVLFVSLAAVLFAAMPYAAFAADSSPNAPAKDSREDARANPGLYAAEVAPADNMTTQGDPSKMKVTDATATPDRPFDVGKVTWTGTQGLTVTFQGRSKGWGCWFDVTGAPQGGSGGSGGEVDLWYSSFKDNGGARIVFELNSPGETDDYILYGPHGAILTVNIEGGSEQAEYEIELSYTSTGSPAGEVTFSKTSLTLNGQGGSEGVVLDGDVVGGVKLMAECSNATNNELDTQVIPIIAKLQFKLPGGNFQDFPGTTQEPGTLYVERGTTVELKAVPEPEGSSWPANFPQWDGSFGAVGFGETITVASTASSSSMTHTFTIEAHLDTLQEKTENAISWEDIVNKFEMQLTEGNPATLEVHVAGKFWSPDEDGDGQPDTADGRVEVQAVSEEDTDGSTYAKIGDPIFRNGESFSHVIPYITNIQNETPYSSTNYCVATVPSVEHREYYASIKSDLPNDILLETLSPSEQAKVDALALLIKVPVDAIAWAGKEIALYLEQGGKTANRSVIPPAVQVATAIDNTNYTFNMLTTAAVTNPKFWKWYAKHPSVWTTGKLEPGILNVNGENISSRMTLHINTTRRDFAAVRAGGWHFASTDALAAAWPHRTTSVRKQNGVVHIACWFVDGVPFAGAAYQRTKTVSINVDNGQLEYTWVEDNANFQNWISAEARILWKTGLE